MSGALSMARLERYLEMANRDWERAMKYYLANAQVSAVFFVDLHFVEVGLRNKMSECLKRDFGKFWFEESGFKQHLGERDLKYLKDSLEKIFKNVRRDAPDDERYGQVIAQLSFGYWVSLLHKKYEHSLWTPSFFKMFLGKPPKRSDFSLQVGRLNGLRNRIAHHEPIWFLNLQELYSITLDVCGYLCPATAAFVKQSSLVQVTLEKWGWPKINEDAK